MKAIDYKELKKNGMMLQTQEGLFSVRLHVTGGNLGTKQLEAIREAADRFGSGEIHITIRQAIEIPNVPHENLVPLKEFLSTSGAPVGACGPTVRTITACPGRLVCPRGIIDSPSLARKVDREFYGKPVPHKFKIGISGCPNNCIKAEENDAGIKGWIEPIWNADTCTPCGVCEAACLLKAISMENDMLIIDRKLCIGCGRCIAACPRESLTEEFRGFRLYVGGKIGRIPSLGKKILGVLETEEDTVAALAAVIEFFRKHGKTRERFAETLTRTGFDAVEAHVKETLAQR